MAELGTPVVAETGLALNLGQGAVLRMLVAGDHGAVMELQWGEFHALLPVGQDPDTLAALLADHRLAHTDGLLLADCGSKALNPPEWIAKLSPRTFLVSVAHGDTLGRPDLQVLDAASNYNLLRTDLDGWIEITTDGEGLCVRVERP